MVPVNRRSEPVTQEQHHEVLRRLDDNDETHNKLIDTLSRLEKFIHGRFDLISRLDERHLSLIKRIEEDHKLQLEMSDRQRRMEQCQQRMHQRLDEHEKDHTSIDTAVRDFENAKFSAKALIMVVVALSAITAAGAGMYEWLAHNFPNARLK